MIWDMHRVNSVNHLTISRGQNNTGAKLYGGKINPGENDMEHR